MKVSVYIQTTRERNEGKSHADRDEQFKYINFKTQEFIEEEQPVISVDAKKKELVGMFSNNGKEYHKQGNPTKVNSLEYQKTGEDDRLKHMLL